MLILEGPDGAGKTTLAREIMDHWGIEMAPRVVDKDTNKMTDLVTWVEENVAEGKQWKLFDRHRLISEPIYGSIVRAKPSDDEFMKMNWMKRVMQQFYDTEPLIIYCMPPLEIVKENVRRDDDNAVVRMYTEKLYAAYATRASIDYALSPGNVIIWDYTQSSDCLDPYFELNDAINKLKEATHG